MTDTTRDLIQRMAKELDLVHQELTDDRRKKHPLANEARAYLAQSESEYPSDKELLKLMPESIQDELSYAAKLYSDATSGQVKPSIFRAGFNTAALEYAQAVLAHYTS